MRSALVFVALLPLTACSVELASEEEATTDAPLPADAGTDADPVDAPRPVPEVDENILQLPFPCGEIWEGQTRTGHSPQLSVDFNRANDDGDTVVAAASGTITRVANTGNTSYGRWIEIAHSGGRRTRYAHLSSQTVTVGQVVRRGHKIGTVGTTGGSSGPHLHYEQHANGSVVSVTFNEVPALYYGTKSYTSENGCEPSP